MSALHLQGTTIGDGTGVGTTKILSLGFLARNSLYLDQSCINSDITTASTIKLKNFNILNLLFITYPWLIISCDDLISNCFNTALQFAISSSLGCKIGESAFEVGYMILFLSFE